MKIGFTGTQKGLTGRQKAEVFRLAVSLQKGEFHHGDCIGADFQAAGIFSGQGWHLVMHPPVDGTKRVWAASILPHIVVHEAKPYLDRNRDIVNSCELLIACPDSVTEKLRSGTWSTVRYARKIGREIVIIYP
jgi:hypothetical protein